MEKGTKICKVCGKEYPYCKNWSNSDIFRWQDVACCEEHGQQYFEEILRSRGELPEEPSSSAKASDEDIVQTPPRRRASRSHRSEDSNTENG